MSADNDTPAAKSKSASSGLLNRFINAIVKEFKPELDAFSTQYAAAPTRVCKSCFKPDTDESVFYAFNKPGLCDRCEKKISAEDSIGITKMELR